MRSHLSKHARKGKVGDRRRHPMLVPTDYDPSRHQVLQSSPPLLSFLRGKFPKHAPHLFLYRHLVWGTFGLAGWIPRKQNVRRFVDLLPLGGTLALDRGEVRFLETLLNPRPSDVTTAQSHSREDAEKEREILRGLQEESEEAVDLKRHIMKKYVRDPGPFYADAKRATPIKQRYGQYSRREDAATRQVSGGRR